jgi:hypothetical protein
MSFGGRRGFFAGALLGATLAVPILLRAQDAATTARSNSSRPSLAHSPSGSKDDRSPPLPPNIPIKSPVEFFRELLAMTPSERSAALTNRAPESRKMILTKLKEYAALDADERELRLQVTELRWYLWPLMNTPATNRLGQLTNVPAGQRILVESRLKEWDALPDEVRKELLENEATRKYFTEIQGRTPEQQKRILAAMPPAQRQALQQGIDKWNGLTDEQRRNLSDRFNQFLVLTEPERDKVLTSLSQPERRQIEKTLQAFSRLPAKERAECIQSFEKFASLSLVQRQLFLRNAERWRQMTPNERQAWRDLVKKVPSALTPRDMPPLPPDLPPLPVMTTHSSHPAPPVATNGN